MDLTRQLLTIITDLGDSAAIAAIAVAAALDLAWSGYRRAALIMVGVLFAAAAAIGLLKIAVIGCSGGRLGPELNSPSGHAAMATAVLGTLSFVVETQIRDWRRIVPPLLAALLIAMIAWSRVLLGAHTVEEVIVGLATGAMVAIPAIVLLRRSRVVRVRLGALLLVVVVVAAAANGTRAPAETLVVYIAQLVQRTIPACAAPLFG